MCGVLLFAAVGYGGVAYQLQQTLFSADFAFAEIERADPVRTTKSTLLEYLPANPSTVLTEALDTSLETQRPWLVAELRKGAVAVQDYLRGAAGQIVIQIDPAPIRQALLDHAQAALEAQLLPEVRALSDEGRVLLQATVRQAAEEAFKEIGVFRFNSETLAPDVRALLQQLRSRLGLFRVPLVVVVCLIVAIAVMAALVGEMRKAAVGILAGGLVLLLPVLFVGRIVEQIPVPAGVPIPSVAIAYLPTLGEHVMQPLLPVALGAVAVGLVGFMLSLMTFARPRRRGQSVSRYR
jgi:hypothetical protein